MVELIKTWFDDLMNTYAGERGNSSLLSLLEWHMVTHAGLGVRYRGQTHENQLMNRLIDWYKLRHPDVIGKIDNPPLQQQSIHSLMQLETSILQPLENEFGALNVTYGFTSLKLKNYLLKNSPGQMAPSLDQHTASEINSRGSLICKRKGAACDFLVSGFEDRMQLIAKHIIEHLPFDRLYFYSPQNAIHVSVGPENARAVQMMKPHPKGFFVPTKRATGKEARYLFENN